MGVQWGCSLWTSMEITESKYVKTSEFDISSEMEVLIGTWVGKNDVFSVAMFDCRDLNWPPTSGNMEVYIANKRSQKKLGLQQIWTLKFSPSTVNQMG